MVERARDIDRNDLAVKVSEMEGGPRQVDIAQIKEVQRCTFEALGAYPLADIVRLLIKYQK